MAKKREYSVYVIELDKKVLKINRVLEENPNRDIEKEALYVGQTAHTPEYRFEQHLNGYKANRYVKKFGRKLRYDLFEKYNPIATREEAESLEEKLALELRELGYTVWYGV